MPLMKNTASARISGLTPFEKVNSAVAWNLLASIFPDRASAYVPLSLLLLDEHCFEALEILPGIEVAFNGGAHPYKAFSDVISSAIINHPGLAFGLVR